MGLNSGQNSDPASFFVSVSDVSIGNNKSMLALMNSSTVNVKLKITLIKIINSRTTNIVGVVAEFRLRRITASSGGSLLNIYPQETNDVLDSGVTARSAGTSTDLSGPVDLSRYLYSSDEWGPGTADVESTDHTLQTVEPAYVYRPGTKSIVLRPNEGLDVRQITNSTNGNFDVIMIFTQE